MSNVTWFLKIFPYFLSWMLLPLLIEIYRSDELMPTMGRRSPKAEQSWHRHVHRLDVCCCLLGGYLHVHHGCHHVHHGCCCCYHVCFHHVVHDVRHVRRDDHLFLVLLRMQIESLMQVFDLFYFFSLFSFYPFCWLQTLPQFLVFQQPQNF